MPTPLKGVKIPRADYDAIEAVRATQLKKAAKSLYHFNQDQKGNNKVTATKQKNWDMGTLSHAINLENDISKIKIFDGLKPDGTEYSSPRASKAYKEMADKTDGYIVTKKEFQELSEKRVAFLGGKGTEEVMAGAEVELAFCAQDPLTGLWLKCQADIVNLKQERFADFKGCPDASEYGVGRMAAKAKWPIQIGHYAYVIELATGVRMKRFDFIAQEFQAPHYTESHTLSDMDLENCMLGYRELLNRLAVAVKEDYWPGYKKRGSLVLPPWAYEFEELENEEWGL